MVSRFELVLLIIIIIAIMIVTGSVTHHKMNSKLFCLFVCLYCVALGTVSKFQTVSTLRFNFLCILYSITNLCVINVACSTIAGIKSNVITLGAQEFDKRKNSDNDNNASVTMKMMITVAVLVVTRITVLKYYRIIVPLVLFFN